jgi:OOP family OmpA-OmpF porin
MLRRFLCILTLAIAFTSLMSCATKKYVQQQVGTTKSELSAKIDEEASRRSDLGNQVQELSSLNKKNSSRIEQLDTNLNTAVKSLEPKIEDAKKTGSDAQGSANLAMEAAKSNATAIANINKYEKTVLTSDVFFKLNSAALDDKARETLQGVAKAMAADKDLILELRGFTDSTGDPQYNVQLSDRRVDSVIRQLVAGEKVELHRIHSLGMGKDESEENNKSAAARAKARRVSLTVLGWK